MPIVKGIVFENKVCHSFPNVPLKGQLEQEEPRRYYAIQWILNMTESQS
jgi:hypothetical protein